MSRSSIVRAAAVPAAASILLLSGFAAGATLHPNLRLLDAEGRPVVQSGAPISTMRTCDGCHDVRYIDEHNSHAGLAFMRCDPILYGDGPPDSMRGPVAEDWIIRNGKRCTGGGVLGDILELDCFLCHIPDPDGAARDLARGKGELEWMTSATLGATGLVERIGEKWSWNAGLFTSDGEVKPGVLEIVDPANRNCGLCHGSVHVDNRVPLSLKDELLDIPETARRGQILSPQRISLGAMNLEGKAALSRPWDAHLARVVSCVECHYSSNNPTYVERSDKASLSHLNFDARRIDISEFLMRPSHVLAAGGDPAGRFDGKAKASDCGNCHDPDPVHKWLPYWRRHLQVLRCETCHIPKIYGPALQQVDWTMLDESGDPLRIWRGWDGEPADASELGRGYEPLLLPCDQDGGRIAPFNIVSSWRWTQGDSGPAVPTSVLDDILFEGGEPGRYRPGVVEIFDDDGDGRLSAHELRLVKPRKTDFIRRSIEARGFEGVEIESRLSPYALHHDVAGGEWSTKDCESCHSDGSRIGKPFRLASYSPGAVGLNPSMDCPLNGRGVLRMDASGAIRFRPAGSAEGVYLLGLTRLPWVDGLGVAFVLATLLGILVHSALRLRTSKRQGDHKRDLERIYMYTIYERLWHWLQALAIIGLALTGLVVHKTDIFPVVDFKTAVQVHNVLGFAMLANALLALFYHLASGQIRQYMPQPRGFFAQMIKQGRYYAYGIFHGEAHPFQKHPERKLNPLQQMTYFAILNILLPLQVLSGLLIWGTQRWPTLADDFGGLPFLAPAHTLLAWVFASFIVMHVYLTTMGHRPMASIQSMIDGWDDVEVPAAVEEGR